MRFSDIHIHALSDCDDGAKSAEQMYKMIHAAYMDGARYICLTPHYNPGYFDENKEGSQKSFERLSAYAAKKYPDLCLALGNELRYNPGCAEWLADGRCRCLNNTNYVLVDFFEGESKGTISAGLEALLNAGYTPILAHAERYRSIRGDVAFLKELRDNGVLIQIDAGSVLGTFGCCTRTFCRRILRRQMADFVSSDAHGMRTRPPGMGAAYAYIEKKCSKSYAEAVCCKNALHMIFGYSL